MTELTIEYEAPRGGEVSSEGVSPDVLLKRIDDIKRRFQDGLNEPYGVDVVNDRGDRMTVGYDDREGFLMLYLAGDDDWRYSLGDVRREDTRVFYLPRWSELSGKYMVPTHRVQDALRYWAETGAMGDQVRWTAEIY